MRQTIRNWSLLLGVMSVVIAIDQASKWWVVNNLMLYETVTLGALSPFLRITRSFNTGAAFGIFNEAGDLFLILAVLIVGALLFFYPRLPPGVWLVRLALGLICGGAIGNAIDRVIHGHVVDFFHITIPNLISNVSNFADHAIVLGVGLLIYDNWRGARSQLSQPESAARQPSTADSASEHPTGND